MNDNGLLLEDVFPTQETDVRTILVKTVEERNHGQLVKWFAEQERYEAVEGDIRTGEFDCCILDRATLLEDGDAIRSRKREELIPLPFVLLAPEQRADDVITALQTDSRDLHSLVDEMLRVPVSHLELERRLESVLRPRHQAMRIHEEHEQLRAIRDKHRGHGIIITDTEGTIEYVNRGFERQSGYSAKEALGENPRILKSGEHDDSFFADLWETVLSGEEWSGEVINERKDGQRYIVDQVITPLPGPDGEIEYLVAVNHEITEVRELADSLEKQRAHLELLNRVLRHDVRNDMSVIFGWLEVLESHVDSDGEAILDRIQASGQYVV
ncbi:MAG: PAS domain S-box protein, partial [Halobacteriales archaeon]